LTPATVGEGENKPLSVRRNRAAAAFGSDLKVLTLGQRDGEIYGPFVTLTRLIHNEVSSPCKQDGGGNPEQNCPGPDAAHWLTLAEYFWVWAFLRSIPGAGCVD